MVAIEVKSFFQVVPHDLIRAFSELNTNAHTVLFLGSFYNAHLEEYLDESN